MGTARKLARREARRNIKKAGIKHTNKMLPLSPATGFRKQSLFSLIWKEFVPGMETKWDDADEQD